MDGADKGQPPPPPAAARAKDAARLFFALWPDAIVRAQLRRWAADLHRTCGGRRVREQQLHVTLAFLGDVPLVQVPKLHALAASLTCPDFTLRFDTPGYWPRKHLVWAAPAAIPEGLAALASGLAGALQTVGLRVEDRPYFPHVTLVRDAGCRGLPELEGFAWRVGDFVLVESTLGSTGSTYRVIGRWPLLPPDHPAAAEGTSG